MKNKFDVRTLQTLKALTVLNTHTQLHVKEAEKAYVYGLDYFGHKNQIAFTSKTVPLDDLEKRLKLFKDLKKQLISDLDNYKNIIDDPKAPFEKIPADNPVKKESVYTINALVRLRDELTPLIAQSESLVMERKHGATTKEKKLEISKNFDDAQYSLLSGIQRDILDDLGGLRSPEPNSINRAELWLLKVEQSRIKGFKETMKEMNEYYNDIINDSKVFGVEVSQQHPAIVRARVNVELINKMFGFIHQLDPLLEAKVQEKTALSQSASTVRVPKNSKEREKNSSQSETPPEGTQHKHRR